MRDSAWLWWLGAGFLILLAEVLSLDLILLMLAGGAFAASGAAALGADVIVQFIVFLVVAVLLLGALRPWLLKNWLQREELPQTNAAAHVGRIALTVTDVDGVGGRIKLVGEVWTARTVDGAELHPDVQVEVVAIEGATAVVKAVQSQN